jgi:aminoglycoside phosphotransferase (APT) family kinase protein
VLGRAVSELPALAAALDGERMLPALAEAAGLARAGLSCAVEPGKYTPGAQALGGAKVARCTLRYRLTREGREVAALFGKLYRDKETAARTYGRLQTVFGHFSKPLSVPAPLALLPELGLVLQRYLAADELSRALPSSPPLALAARWLATLHQVPAPPGLRTMTLPHELGKVARWCGKLAPEGRLGRLQGRLIELAKAIAYTPALVHHDFNPANILWDGKHLWVLDFDELRIGDPALDIGHFLAHLEALAHFRCGDWHAFAGAAEGFLRSYLERNPLDLGVSLTFYRAYTFLKLAALETDEATTRALADRACLELEGA